MIDLLKMEKMARERGKREKLGEEKRGKIIQICYIYRQIPPNQCIHDVLETCTNKKEKQECLLC